MAQAQYYFDWDFSKLETTARIGNYTDVITRVYWTMWASDDQGNQVPLYGETEIDVSEFEGATVDDFVEYSKVTKEHVEEILENSLGEDRIAQMTDDLKTQLIQLEQSAVTARVPPWVA